MILRLYEIFSVVSRFSRYTFHVICIAESRFPLGQCGTSQGDMWSLGEKSQGDMWLLGEKSQGDMWSLGEKSQGDIFLPFISQ